MTLRWHIDELNGRHIVGWIDDDGPVVIEVSVNGRIVATLLPTEYRKDLEDAGIGDGRRSFVFPIDGHLVDPDNLVIVKHDGHILASQVVRPSVAPKIVVDANFSPTQSRDLTFIQTADPIRYREMLQLTSRTVIEYCGRNNHSCHLFIGICRGYHPWHACFNRIILLARLLNSGFCGWACYLDADAFIADLDFDARNYLADKGHLAIIITTDNAADPARPYWAINSGTFFINLGNPVGQQIVKDWAKTLDAVPDAQLREAADWSFDDQGMLSDILRALPNGSSHVLTLHEEPHLINYSRGTFIRQILRADLPFRERQALLKTMTDRVLGLS